MVEEAALPHCVPCRGGVPPLSEAEVQTALSDVPGWEVLAEPQRIMRSFRCKDFLAAQSFACQVGAIAEAEGHHPDIAYGWGYCTVSFHTHKIGGLHRNDFLMAARVNRVAAPEGAEG